ncbi:MAG: GNAT family N-acetyltransferase [Gammaproteobacteria bacterium]|nr:GNAT family N-acetyltransferase [Gammaproteobacteria bacterium]
MNETLANKITIEKADPLILPLVKRFFSEQGMRAQAAKIDEVIIARLSNYSEHNIIGALRLCPIENSWLLRSMSIEKGYQRQGIGSFMLNQITRDLAEKGCYCFPFKHLEKFYQKAGFQLIEVTKASPEIQQLFQQYIDNGKDILIMQFI